MPLQCSCWEDPVCRSLWAYLNKPYKNITWKTVIKDKLININSSCAGSLEYLLGGTWVLANSSVQVTKPCPADSLAGEGSDNTETESTGNAWDADSRSRSNPPGKTRTLHVCLQGRLLFSWRKGKKTQPWLSINRIVVSFFPGTSFFQGLSRYGMRSLKENPSLPRRRQRQMMERNKVRVKNMSLLSSRSYSLEKKVPEATDKDPRRGYDVLGQADFSSDSREVYKPRPWEIQEPNFIEE